MRRRQARHQPAAIRRWRFRTRAVLRRCGPRPSRARAGAAPPRRRACSRAAPCSYAAARADPTSRRGRRQPRAAPSRLPDAAARPPTSGRWSRERVSFAFTSAPASTSSLIGLGLPFLAANISIVSPFGAALFRVRSCLEQSARPFCGLPDSAAIESGVTPCAVGAFTFAPALTSASAISTLSRYTAQCSAVEPSTCGGVDVGFLLDQRANASRRRPSWRRRPPSLAPAANAAVAVDSNTATPQSDERRSCRPLSPTPASAVDRYCRPASPRGCRTCPAHSGEGCLS